MDKEATEKMGDDIYLILQDIQLVDGVHLVDKGLITDGVSSGLYHLGYRRVICPECLHIRDEDRVKNGMKCSYCAGYGGK